MVAAESESRRPQPRTDCGRVRTPARHLDPLEAMVRV
jgi:hypothetical protein